MSELRHSLREEFQNKDYRLSYADESLSTYIATQIKVLREQRNWTQQELANFSGMAQPRIALLEDINYSSWSISTLKRLAQAFDLRLSVKFETFSSLIPEIETFSRDSLKRASFDEDTWFHTQQIQPSSEILKIAYSGSEQTMTRKSAASVLSMPQQIRIAAGAATAAGAR
jgi:transcriptional regulator with XRE-family HTH domain